MQRTWCFIALVGAVSARSADADWPQFLGPMRDGTTTAAGLARQWPPEGPKQRWRVPLGVGYGGAAIHNGQVFVLDRVDNQRDVMRVFDLKSGEELWTYAYDSPGRVSHDGSRSTPALDDRFAFTVGPFGEIFCIDRVTHEMRWTRHFIDDYGADAPSWGFSQSPLLVRDMVVVAPLSRKAGIVALDKATGQERWRTGPLGETGERYYVSPLLTTVDGVEQIVMMAKPYVAGFDATNGKMLWKYDGYRCKIQIPGPTPIGDGRFFLTGGYGAGSAMIQVHRIGERFEVKSLFRRPDYGSIIPNTLLVNGYLYANINTKKSKDGLACIDLEGHVQWKTQQSPRLGWGNMIAADGLIYFVDGASGKLHLIEPRPHGFRQLASSKLLDGKEIWAPLALSDGNLVIRDQAQMKCIDVATH